ncbi:MAG: MlaD family protein [Sulfuricurvum sp.]
MERKANFILVGVFAFVGTLALAYFAYWLGKYGLDNRPFAYYETYLNESVSGLKGTSLVKLRGIDVGSVEAVELDPLDPQRVRVTFKVYQGTPVKTDTTVRLNAQGIAGTTYLELKGGTRESSVLAGSEAKRGVIASELSTLSVLSDKALAASEMLNATLVKVQQTMNGRNLQNLSQMLENGAKFSRGLEAHHGEWTQLAKTTQTLEENATQTLVSLNHTVADARELTRSARETTDQASALLRDVNQSGLVGKMGTVLDNANDTVDETRQTVQEAKAFVRELRERPSNLLFK